MRIEFSPTIDELSELLTVGKATRRRTFSPAMTEAFSSLIIAACLTFFAVSDSAAPLTEKRLAPEQNLWTCLSPMLFVTGWVVARFVLLGRIKKFHSAATSAKSLKSLQAREYVSVAAGIIWFVPWNFRIFAIVWHPTDGQLVCAATAVWLYGRAVIHFLSVGSAKSAAAWSFKNAPSSKAERIIELTDESAMMTLADVTVRYNWPHFVRAVETKNLLMLVDIDGSPLYFAKRCLPDAAGITAVKSLMQSHVPVVEFFATPAGFPVQLLTS